MIWSTVPAVDLAVNSVEVPSCGEEAGRNHWLCERVDLGKQPKLLVDISPWEYWWALHKKVVVYVNHKSPNSFFLSVTPKVLIPIQRSRACSLVPFIRHVLIIVILLSVSMFVLQLLLIYGWCFNIIYIAGFCQCYLEKKSSAQGLLRVASFLTYITREYGRWS